MHKRFSLRWFVAAVLVFGCVVGIADEQLVPYDPNTMSYPISPAEALQAVRDWSENPALTVNLLGVEQYHDPTLADRYRYESSDGTNQYQVDCFTGEMICWYDQQAYHAYYASREALGQDPQLSPAYLRQVGRSFVRSKYASFDDLHMELYVPDATGTQCYAQHLENGAWYIGNHALCRINEWTGQVLMYFARHGPPIGISVTPHISSSEAEEIALNHVMTMTFEGDSPEGEPIQYFPQSAFILENNGLLVRVDDLGLQRLRWELEVVVSGVPGYNRDMYEHELSEDLGITSGTIVDVYVDAQTGVVFYAELGGTVGGGDGRSTGTTKQRIWARLVQGLRRLTNLLVAPIRAQIRAKHARSVPNAQPKVVEGTFLVDGSEVSEFAYPLYALDSRTRVDGCKYVYAKYLPALYGGILEWRQSAARMSVAGKKVVLWPGSTDINIEGKRVSLKDPVKIIAGRTYVPLEAFKVICGAEATWDKEANVLRIVSGQIKPKTQFSRIAGTDSSDRSERSGMP